MKNNQAGFSAMEMMVVVAIIAILAMIAIPSQMGRIVKEPVGRLLKLCLLTIKKQHYQHQKKW